MIIAFGLLAVPMSTSRGTMLHRWRGGRSERMLGLARPRKIKIRRAESGALFAL
jgi:hypothetical protein